MKAKTTTYFLLVLMLSFGVGIYGQSINILGFDTSLSYAPSASVSVIINPTDTFKVNNSFVLELSAPGGSWATRRTLATVNEFYTPLINATLPSDLLAGNYKLRIRSTHPVRIEETASFTVTAATAPVLNRIISGFVNSTNYFNCINCVGGSVIFGSHNQSDNANTAALSMAQKQLRICAYDATADYSVNMYDVLRNTTVEITRAGGFFYIPNNLDLGTYVFELTKTINNVSTVYSVAFLFHGNGTSLGNASSEAICVGSSVAFNIDRSMAGIGRNYLGTKYEVNFGDGGEKVFYTQAQLMSNPTIEHTYMFASCSENSSFFTVSMNMYSKGILGSCNEYEKNGGGVTKSVNASTPPIAEFMIPEKWCASKPIRFLNKSIPGFYGTSGCKDASNFYWYIKAPGDTEFTYLSDGAYIGDNNDLLLPEGFLNQPGCWQIMLEAQNQDLCQTISQAVKTMIVEAVPTALFSMSTNEICASNSVTITNNSNVLTSACSRPIYQWTINNIAGNTIGDYNFLGGNVNSENQLELRFNNPGVYAVSLKVSNVCGEAMSSVDTIRVLGNPDVHFVNTQFENCIVTNDNFRINFFDDFFKPIYSEGVFKINSYNWTISGAGVDSNDYEFVANTDASNAFPVIDFKSYKNYRIEVAIVGVCGTEKKATFDLILKNKPQIFVANNKQTICSGNTSEAIQLTSDRSEVVFEWTVEADAAIQTTAANGAGAVIPTASWINETNQAAYLKYNIIAKTNECVSDTLVYTIEVLPVAELKQVNDMVFHHATTVNAIVFEALTSGQSLNVSWTNSNPSIGIAESGQGNIPKFVAYNISYEIQTAIITVVPTISNTVGACQGDTMRFTISVYPRPTMLAVSNQLFCANDSAFVDFSTDNVGVEQTYEWTSSNPAIGLASSGNGRIAFVTQNNTAQIIKSSISVTAVITLNGVRKITKALRFDISVMPQVSASNANNLVLCNNETFADLNFTSNSQVNAVNYKWSNNNTSIGLAATGEGALPSFVAVNNTQLPITATITVLATATHNGVECQGIEQNFDIVVLPHITMQAVDARAVCPTKAIFVQFDSNMQGGTMSYEWTNDNVNTGLAAAGTGNIDFVAANSTLAPIVSNINVRPVFNYNGHVCYGDYQSFTITVRPVPQVVPVPDKVVCNQQAVESIDFFALNTGITMMYRWTNSNPEIGLPASGEGPLPAFVAVNNTFSFIKAKIHVQPMIDGVADADCLCEGMDFYITVNPSAHVNQVENEVLCSGENFELDFTTSNTCGVNDFIWYNNNPNIGLAANGVSGISFDAVNNTNTIQIANITVIPTFEFEGKACSGSAKYFTITVLPNLKVTDINDITLCNNEQFAGLAFGSNVSNANISYRWTNDNPTIGLASEGEGALPAFTAINLGLENVEANINVFATISSNGYECEGEPMSFKVIVRKSPKLHKSADVSVCKGATAPRIRFEAYNGVAPYRITYQINNGAIQTLNASSADNSISFTVPTNNEGRFVYRILSVSDASATACANTVRDSIVVFISSNPIIDQQPLANQLVCVGAQPEQLMVAYSGGAGSAQIQWFANTTNDNFGGTLIPNANQFIFQPETMTQVGEYYYYAVVTLQGESCSLAVSQVAKITVVPDPTFVVQPIAMQSTCVNGTVAPLTVLTSGGIGTASYQWYRNTTPNIDNMVEIANANQASYTPPTNAVGEWFYICIAKQNALDCNAISEFAKVVVTENPVLTSSFEAQSICLNDVAPVLEVKYSGGVSDANYQWYRSADLQRSNAVAIQGARAAQYQPSFSNAGNYFYYCVVNFNSNSCANLLSDVAQITVRQHPVINNITTNVSSGQTFVVQPQTDDNNIVPIGTQYIWQVASIFPANAITGATDVIVPQNNISQTLHNVLGANAVVNYLVTPLFNGCTGNAFTVTVEVKATLNVHVAKTDIVCFGDNAGKLAASVSGGMPFKGNAPYQIQWTYPNGTKVNEAAIQNLLAGEYHLLVRDSLGLTHESTHILTQNEKLTVAFNKVNMLTCFESNNGTIESLVAGGKAPYRYSWSKNNSAFSTDSNLQQLLVGNYQLTVTDDNGCVAVSEIVTISQPSPISIELINKTDNLCFADNQGAISVNVSGGTTFSGNDKKYNFRWTGPNAFVSDNMNISNLLAGDYQLEVTDANACTAYFNVTIAQPNKILLSSTVVSESCYGSNDATATVHVSGGVAPYSAVWSNLATGFVQTNLSAGKYSVQVTDANNCVKTIDLEVVKDSVFSISPVLTQITCNGQRNASIVLNIHSKFPNVKVRWADNPTAGNARYNLSAGIYTVNITNGTSCEINESFAIYEPSPIRITGTVKDAISCSDQTTGTISVAVSGGTAPYAYRWSNGATTPEVNGLDGGEYFVTVTDANGCSAIEQFQVVRPLPIKIIFDTKYNVNPTTNIVTLTQEAKVSGGIPPYTYQWAHGISHNDNNQKADFYESRTTFVKVTDALGCEKTQSFNADVPLLAIQYESMSCTSLDYAFRFDVPDYIFGQPQYIWEFGDGKSSTARQPIHTYSATGNYTVKLHVAAAQAMYTFELPLYVNAIPSLVLNRAPVICHNDSLMLTVNGANSYLWSDGTTGNRMMLSKPGDYFVIGKSLAGCTSILSFNATLHNELNFVIQSDRDYVTPESPTMRLWTEKVDSCVYAWDFGDATVVAHGDGHEVVHTFQVTKPTPLRVKLNVTTQEGCVEVSSKRIFALSGDLPNTFTPNGDGINDRFMENTDIEVYNSKGVLLYKGNEGWDGKYKGTDMPVDTYYYILLFYSENGIESKPGFITIIR